MWIVPVLVLLGSVVRVSGSELVVSDMLTEFRIDPLGVDAAFPRLSWRMESDRRGQHQTAYRILVATSPHLLESGTGDAWDTGRVASENSHLVPYAGAPLEPGKTYYWQVRVWDREGSVAEWSHAARWTMGRLGDWGNARWIGPDSLASVELGMARDQLPLMRRAFEIGKPVRRATVHVSGLGMFSLYANGEECSADLFAPGWTNVEKTILYSTYDITHLLHQGDNVIGIALGHGMYHIPGTPEDGRYAKFYGPLGQPKMVLYLTIEHNDGTSSTLVSDTKWRVAGGPITFSSIWGGEDYDARLEQPGWSAPGFDDEDWVAAAVHAAPGGKLRASAVEPVREHEVFRPVAVTSPDPGVYLYDLGQNHAGRMRLTVRGQEGARITLRPSEVLGDDGRIDQTSMRHEGSIYFQYTARGDSVEIWSPLFTYTGYRYVQVEGATPDPEKAEEEGIPLILGLESRFVHADVAFTGRVATSSAVLNGIHTLIVQAIRSNTMSVMTDCPHREKLGWLEQAHLHAPGIHYNLNTATLYAKWINDMAEAQTETGLIPDIAPELTIFENGFRDSPEWGSAFILAPLASYWHFGDKAPLVAHFEAMKAYVEYLESRRDDRGLLSYGLGDWYDIAPGPPGRSRLTSEGLTSTAIYIADLRALSEIARIVGKTAESGAFMARAEESTRAFNEAFYDNRTGRYDRGSQTAQAMPLALGLVPEGREEEVLSCLVEDISARDMHTTAGDIGHRYVLLALSEGNRSDLIYWMAVNPEPPSYAAQLNSGATTLTEAWDADRHSSQNHFMLGHLEEWFYTAVSGITPAEPGFQRVLFRPQPIEQLEWADVEYNSVRGLISSAWRREAGFLILDISIPPGATGEVHMPARSIDEITEGGIPVLQAEGVTLLRIEDGLAVVEIGSGTYRFASRE